MKGFILFSCKIKSINQSINQSKEISYRILGWKKAYLYYIKMINIIVFCEVNPKKNNLGNDFSYILIEFKIMGTQVHFHAEHNMVFKWYH